MKYQPKRTHVECVSRRKLLAEHVSRGESVRWVAKHYCVGVNTVYFAIHENKVALPGPKLKPEKRYARLTAADWSKPNIELAREFVVSREYIRQARNWLNERGLIQG